MGDPNRRLNGKAFTCTNNRFWTKRPISTIIDYGNDSLRLEEITDKTTDAATYWLMWYDAKGNPTIPESAVFSKEYIPRLIKELECLSVGDKELAGFVCTGFGVG